jgi:subtilisin family serine protease
MHQLPADAQRSAASVLRLDAFAVPYLMLLAGHSLTSSFAPCVAAYKLTCVSHLLLLLPILHFPLANPSTDAGVVGLAPGLPLYSLKVLDAQGVGALSDAMAAVEWAASAEGRAKANIKVINLSLAAYISPADPDYQATLDLVCASFKTASDAGIVLIAAAGNYAADTRGYLPASCPTVIAVTSMDPSSNTVSSFSNFMPDNSAAADKNRVIAAPGSAILSTISYGREPSGYRELSGTSMASPHVAGVAATCFLSGACPTSGVTGIQQLEMVKGAAQERLGKSAGYGFAGDASSTSNGKYYGNLLWAKF